LPRHGPRTIGAVFRATILGVRRLAFILSLAAAALAGAPSAMASTVSIPASADIGFPFWCDWSYDWESRCFRDDGPRLPIGGVGDKVWRSGIRFSLEGIPPTATITSAELRVYHDGLCVAPGAASVPCVAPGAVIDAHRILSRSWFQEREPELEERVLDTAVVFSAPDPQWLTWNVTSLAGSWRRGLVPNAGILLKLQDGNEGYEVPGPHGPSSTHPDAALRPRLVVTYEATGTR
jgi:TGF-beta propeptide